MRYFFVCLSPGAAEWQSQRCRCDLERRSVLSPSSTPPLSHTGMNIPSRSSGSHNRARSLTLSPSRPCSTGGTHYNCHLANLATAAVVQAKLNSGSLQINLWAAGSTLWVWLLECLSSHRTWWWHIISPLLFWVSLLWVSCGGQFRVAGRWEETAWKIDHHR